MHGRGERVTTSTTQDLTTDVIVVGTGAAGLTAALAAASRGLSVRVVEKAPTFGGSTARSGGGVWVPGNAVLRAAGLDREPADAARYVKQVAGDDADPDLQAAFLTHGPAAIDLVLKQTPLRLRWIKGYSDYYPERDGGLAAGRSVEPLPLDANLLGEDRERLNPPYLAAGGGLVITGKDFKWLNLIARHPRGLTTALRVGIRSYTARLRGKRLLTMGQALSAGLWLGVKRLGVEVWLDTPMIGLGTDPAGRACSVTVTRDGAEVTLHARRGIVLASGGFEFSAELRAKHQRQPIGTTWTVGARENTGDAFPLGETLGAGTALMDDAWWGPSVLLPRGPYFLLAERSLPGCLMVNAAGQRFANESAPYVDAVHAMYEAHSPQTPAIPSWLIFDQRYRDRYIFMGLGPRQAMPKNWYRSGVAVKATSIEKLAAEIGVPDQALSATISRFNDMASQGTDLDFSRGRSAYDNYYGDPRNKPNPNLGALTKPPFYAVQIVPGDLGTKGGFTTDARARVLRTDGSVIPGLYAAGNTSALVMGRSYAGAGATIGPAITFGYIAAQDLVDGPGA
jgi:3-oxosteroid 1-dehydrogenase